MLVDDKSVPEAVEFVALDAPDNDELVALDENCGACLVGSSVASAVASDNSWSMS